MWVLVVVVLYAGHLGVGLHSVQLSFHSETTCNTGKASLASPMVGWLGDRGAVFARCIERGAASRDLAVPPTWE